MALSARILVTLCAIFTSALASEIFYSFGAVENDEIKRCVEGAVKYIEVESCLTFTETSTEPMFTVHESMDCSWQPDNRTLHLAPGCMSNDNCLEMLGKAIDVDQPKHDLMHFINLANNCSSDCSLHCLHGGCLDRETCTCACNYGFTGESCEKLSRAGQFNDDACGEVVAEDAGSISLSTFPGSQQKATFCQWLIESEDAWSTIELSLESLDLDGEQVPSGQTCNDVLTVFGAEGFSGMIPCNGLIAAPSTLSSASNWILIELRTNPWSLKPHAGPSIKYRLRTRPHGVRAHADEMTSAAGVAGLAMSVVALLAAAIC